MNYSYLKGCDFNFEVKCSNFKSLQIKLSVKLLVIVIYNIIVFKHY